MKNSSSPLVPDGHNDLLKKYYHQALIDKRKLHLIIQYTEPYPTLTSDKCLLCHAAHKNHTYFLSQFEKQAVK